MRHNDDGFTMIELLVTMFIFALVSSAIYGVLFASKRAGDSALVGARVSQSARLGLNRMVRDAREGEGLSTVDQNINDDNKVGFTVKVDFDGNGVIASGPNTAGDLELLTYTYSRVTKQLTLNGEVLMQNVECLTTACQMFVYSSNLLQYDWNADGRATLAEIDEAGCPARGSISIGNCNAPDFTFELPMVSNIDIGLKVQIGDVSDILYAHAQLRNLR